MYIIETQAHYHWISGIFQEKASLDTYWQTIPEDLKPFQNIIELPGQTYPLLLIENNGFRIVTAEELHRELRAIETLDDEDHVYFNVYEITEDYTPPHPGEDWMGSLPHFHIDNDYLRTHLSQETA